MEKSIAEELDEAKLLLEDHGFTVEIKKETIDGGELFLPDIHDKVKVVVRNVPLDMSDWVEESSNVICKAYEMGRKDIPWLRVVPIRFRNQRNMERNDDNTGEPLSVGEI